MRLRRIPGARKEITESPLVLKECACLKGVWRERLPEGSLFLEIGMGRGAFIIAKAISHPHESYIGLELREEMILLALRSLRRQGTAVGTTVSGRPTEGFAPPNLFFIWNNAALLTEMFAEGETDGIFLNFSDPWPKARHGKRRLTHPFFWNQYGRILKKGAFLYFRTDDADFFDWSVKSAAGGALVLRKESRDSPLPADGILSEYETRYRKLNKPILSAVWQKE